jgi:hypothetical protein
MSGAANERRARSSSVSAASMIATTSSGVRIRGRRSSPSSTASRTPAHGFASISP